MSASRVAEFHRNGFLVLERVTTSDDVEHIARLLARLYGIPGSHLQGIRPHRRLNAHSHVREATGVDPSGAVACPLRIGDATVHVPRTLHYTGPNLTPWPRIAWSLEFGPRRGLGFRLYAKTKLVWRKALDGRPLGS